MSGLGCVFAGSFFKCSFAKHALWYAAYRRRHVTTDGDRERRVACRKPTSWCRAADQFGWKDKHLTELNEGPRLPGGHNEQPLLPATPVTSQLPIDAAILPLVRHESKGAKAPAVGRWQRTRPPNAKPPAAREANAGEPSLSAPRQAPKMSSQRPSRRSSIAAARPPE